MKSKLILVVLFVAGFALQGMSQVQFAVGLKGGLNLSKFDVNAGASNIDNRTGYHGGAFALIKITKIGIQPEILFSKQGSNFQVNTTNYKANFDYINVPIMLKLYLVAGLNLQVGPQFGFLTIDDLKKTVQNTNSTQSAQALFSKKNDTSINLGAGWDLPFGLTLDARYNIGLSDIKLQADASNPVSFKNKVIQISLGYKLIKLGK